jgi:hypothetical protein
MGVDGQWLRGAKLFRPNLNLRILDLESPMENVGHFDLAICLEVAEHLPQSRAKTFISDLCRLSEATLFSAAIPHQGGTHHVNCQWQSFWCELFSAHDRVPVDVVRPNAWGRPDVAWWYQQNTLLYLTRQRASELKLSPTSMLDLVHPAMLDSLGTILKCIPRSLARAVRGRLLRAR